MRNELPDEMVAVAAKWWADFLRTPEWDSDSKGWYCYCSE